MTYLELVNYLIRRVGIAGSHQDITTVTGHTGRLQLAIDWVREAELDIQRKWNDWTFHNVEAEIAVPANSHFIDENTPGFFKDIARINENSIYGRTDTDRSKLQLLCWADMRDKRGTQESQFNCSIPREISIDPSGRFFFWQPSSESWIINFTGQTKPLELVADKQVSLIPPEYHHIIFHKAAMKYAIYEEAEYLRATHEQEYMMLLQQLESVALPMGDRTNLSSDETPVVVQVM